MEPAGQRSAGGVSNQYQILGHLATGGMAELYIARGLGAPGSERHVVLKRIMADYARNHRFVTMFLDEARLAAQLHHPNIARVHDIGRMGDSYFFTMEYVHGENVRNLLHRVAALKRQLPLEHTLAVIIGAAAGLHYAHDRRGHDGRPLDIVHRDVSPSNLMVSFDGAVKLVDFGIAKAADRMTETRSGAVKGKVSYMSPEQCTGQPLDRRSDIFSLGIILYEMATMTRLFKYGSDFETMNHIVNLPVPPPTSRRPDLPRGLEDIILKALAPRPEDRFATAGELLAALQQFAARERLTLAAPPLGRHIRELFGERPEPWLELEAAGDVSDLITVSTLDLVDRTPASLPLPLPLPPPAMLPLPPPIEPVPSPLPSPELADPFDVRTDVVPMEALLDVTPLPPPTALPVQPPVRPRWWLWIAVATAAIGVVALVAQLVGRDAPGPAAVVEVDAGAAAVVEADAGAAAVVEADAGAAAAVVEADAGAAAAVVEPIRPRPPGPRAPRPPRVVRPPPKKCGDAMGIYPPCE